MLLQYQGTISTLPKSLGPSLEQSSTLLTSFQPESDLTVAIERYRTGPFRPQAHVYERADDVVFGLDLRKWAAGGGEENAIPMVVKGLLEGLEEGYKRLPDDNGACWSCPRALGAVVLIMLLLTLRAPQSVDLRCLFSG